MNETTTPSVFLRDGEAFVPTSLARGPWDENALHGGAPAALLGYLAEQTAGEAFFLARLTFELTRPIPLAPLTVSVDASRGRTARRVSLALEHDGVAVGRALALMLRAQPIAVPEQPDPQLQPGPEDCDERFATPGMPEDGESFHRTAMDIRLAHGSSRSPGPAAAWFSLRVPIVAGVDTTPAMRALAAADFGNGLGWILAFDEYIYTNTDLTVYLHRAPRGEWIGLDTHTIAQPNGVGLSSGTLFDQHGRIGTAQQNLLIRPR